MPIVSVRSTGPDLETVTAGYVRELTQAQRAAGREVAKVGRKAILDDVKSRRGSMRFGKGKLSIRTKVEPSATAASVTIHGVTAGAWTIVDAGTEPHEIVPLRSVGRSRGAHALYFDGLYSAHAAHPGTRGTGVWSNAEAALDRAIAPLIEDIVDEALDI